MPTKPRDPRVDPRVGDIVGEGIPRMVFMVKGDRVYYRTVFWPEKGTTLEDWCSWAEFTKVIHHAD